MRLSRRSFVEGTAGLIFGSWISRHAWPNLEQTPVPRLLTLQGQGTERIPKLVVEDFSKNFDPAYLSNGLIGIRPGPNPLAKAMTQVSGFVFTHVPFYVESLSPAPYPLETDIRVKGTSLLKHPDLLKTQRQTLDMSCGELTTEMLFLPGRGVTLNIQVLQFASRSIPSLVCQEIRVNPSDDLEIEFAPRINSEAVPGQVYMTEPPERTNVDLVSGFVSGGSLSKLGVALLAFPPDGLMQKRDPYQTAAGISRSYILRAQSNRLIRFQTIAAMISDLYHPEPPLEAIRLVNWGRTFQFEELRQKNRRIWSDLWQSRVRVTGDTDAQRVLDSAFFYLHSSVHASNKTGMPPFGLSQYAYYYGHSFWDTETWSLLPITLTAPDAARALLEFRVRGLESAKQQAALYGFRGAQFPWEAAATRGFETTPTFAATGWTEQHVSPDVALGFWEYQLATNDQSFLREGTWPVLSAVAEWIESRGVITERGFEIQHIMGPDEGVLNVNNNSYFNLISKMVLAAAIRCGEMVGKTVPSTWAKIRDSIVLPINKAKNVLLPYDNPPSQTSPEYSLAHMDFLCVHAGALSPELLRNTHDYEESLRTSSNASIGFATAAVAATAAFLGEKQRAAELFRESWRNVWLEPFAMIREAPSQDYGCFLTNFGSLLQTAMLGFTGIRVNEGDWRKYPASLPTGWSRIEIDRFWVRGEPKHLLAVDGAPAKLLNT
jgi:trehalose/maltose hydrolase-like predicted phosphorylase